MKSTNPSRRALQRFFMGALLLPWLPLGAQTIPNPSFEENAYTVFPGYISDNQAAHGAITGWTAAVPEKAGLNPAAGTPIANNGAVPNGSNVAFIQWDASGNSALSTTITDLVVGQRYNVTFRINARSDNQPFLRISTDGDGPVVSAQVSRVSAALDATPYRWAGYEFTATATSHVLTIANPRNTADHTLLIDDFKIAPSSGAWSVSEWTGDEDSGFDANYVYTHALSLGSDAPITINGVDILGREAGTPGRFTLAGLGSVYQNLAVNHVTGSSAALAKDFRYGGNPSITLQNLAPNTEYVFSLYGVGFDASPTYYRSATFQSNLSSEKLTVNLNRYGQGNGMVITYRYTTDAAGSPVTISYPETSGAAGSFHTSGFTNREANPRTAPEVWTLHSWEDDETSGVSPNHHYTHAYNFGTTASANVNGINFTGIAGANPTGSNYSSVNLPGVFNGDVNHVTGTSSLLARDFLYNGFPSAHVLTGLVPGRDYVFTIYSVGWDDGARPGAFVGLPGEGMTILDQDTFGLDWGVRFEYRYTADSSGTLRVTSSAFDGVKSVHTYAISNREAEPLVGVAPTITMQPVGGAVGIDGEFVLRVGATGSGPLNYTWRRGTTVVSSSGPVLVLNPAEFSDSGTYTVTVENSVGSVVSAAVDLKVLDIVAGSYGTGVDPSGEPLPGGMIDPNFKLISNAQNPGSEVTYVQSNIPGAWTPNSATSKWIGPLPDTVGAASGVYVFRTEVDLTVFDVDTVQIVGRWATDNQGQAILVNGENTNIPPLPDTGFGTLVPFTINLSNAPGLIKGVNTIDFVVNNSAVGFVGLRVDGLKALGSIPPGTAPHIAIHPRSIEARHNSVTTLGVAANGSAPLSYQWFRGDEELIGESNPTLDVYIDSPESGGDYRVEVRGTTTVVSEVASVTIGNVDPAAGDDNYTTPNNVPLLIDFFDLVFNDSDADGDQLFLESVATASVRGGTVVTDGDFITYTPPPGLVGLDSFTYTINDGIWGGSTVGNVYIEVTAGAASGAPGQLALEMASGTVTGTFTGVPGAVYTLERSTTLEPNSWTAVDSMLAPESGVVSIVDPAPPTGAAFYRIAYTP